MKTPTLQFLLGVAAGFCLAAKEGQTLLISYHIYKTTVPKSLLPDPIIVDGGIPAYIIPEKVLPKLKPFLVE